ncbi:helix-turn-helix transcriptional regulator [Pantoea sp. GM01]|uniref:helix-turn-helix domain-containing protein n=1 Tax=Pantoea sp. GM01 TaxID=1144320 RepID=UPI0002714413|nr:helix-turn-helix transcriptional regulator [Pantoea sp. GM01]EJL80968.1 Helix-turn-helix protein [Pantoea sp. GM01]
MRSITEIRRSNLIYIIETQFGGNKTATAEAIGVQPNLVSRWSGVKPIGGNAARKIETKLALESYWMDRDRENSTPEVADTAIGAIISRNLREWMDSSETLNTQGKLQKASSVSQSTIQRVLSREVDPTVSVINSIAGAFGRYGYELLMPSADSRQITYDRDAYHALPEDEKEKIHSFIEFVISQSKKG